MDFQRRRSTRFASRNCAISINHSVDNFSMILVAFMTAAPLRAMAILHASNRRAQAAQQVPA
jgi:hypothetical protein